MRKVLLQCGHVCSLNLGMRCVPPLAIATGWFGAPGYLDPAWKEGGSEGGREGEREGGREGGREGKRAEGGRTNDEQGSTLTPSHTHTHPYLAWTHPSPVVLQCCLLPPHPYQLAQAVGGSDQRNAEEMSSSPHPPLVTAGLLGHRPQGAGSRSQSGWGSGCAGCNRWPWGMERQGPRERGWGQFLASHGLR